MENKNNVSLYGLIFFVIGIFVGWMIWGNTNFKTQSSNNSSMMHMMPDGSMMSNVGMDMGSMMDGMMAGLEGKTGDAFDKEFLEEMIIHHQGAVEMAKAVLATSKRPELIQLASDIITAQTKEIGMMQAWEKAWFK